MFHWITSKHACWNADVLGTIYLFDGRPSCTAIFRLKMIPRTTAMIAARESASYCQKGTRVYWNYDLWRRRGWTWMVNRARTDANTLTLQHVELDKWSQISSLAVNLRVKGHREQIQLVCEWICRFLTGFTYCCKESVQTWCHLIILLNMNAAYQEK